MQRISYNPVDGSPSYWEYDKFGNLVSMQEDGKNCISFTNNGWGMPTSVTTGGQTFNLIDGATPNLLTLPGGVEIEIDGSGNEYRRSFPGTADQIFDRDGSGRLRQVTTNGEMAIGIEYSGPLPSRHTMMQSINGPTETIDFTYLDDRISEKTSNLYGAHVFEYDADFPDQISAYSRDDFDYNYDFRNDGYLESLSFGPDGDLETFQYDYDDKGNQSAVAFRDFAAGFEDYQNGLPSTITVQYAGTSSVIDIEQEGGYLTGYTATDSGQVPISFTLDSVSQEKENNENCSEFESTVRIPTRAVKQTNRYLEAITTQTRSDQTLVGAQIVRAAGDLEAITTSSSGGGSGSQTGKRSSSNQNLLSDVENHNVADVLSVDLDINLDGDDDVTAQLLVRRHFHGRSNLLQTVTQQLATVPGDDQLLVQVIFENYGTAGNNLVRGQLDRDLLIFNLDKVGDEWHGTVDYYPMDVLQAQADSDAYQGRVEELTIARNETSNDTYNFGYDVFGNIDGVVDLRSGKETVVFDGSRHVYQIGDDGFTYDAFNRRVSSTDTGLSQNMVYAYHDSKPIAIGYENGTSVRWEYVIVHGPMGALFLYDMNDRDGVDRSYLVYTDHLGTPWAYRSMATGQVFHHSTAPWGDLNHNPVVDQVKDGVAVPHAIQMSGGMLPVTDGHATAGGALKLFETPDFGSLHNFMGLSGHQRDPNGLIYMHHRYYSPLLGHFLTPDFRAPDIYDPTTFTEPYAYAAGNPFMYWDPDGLAVLPGAAGEKLHEKLREQGYDPRTEYDESINFSWFKERDYKLFKVVDRTTGKFLHWTIFNTKKNRIDYVITEDHAGDLKSFIKNYSGFTAMYEIMNDPSIMSEGQIEEAMMGYEFIHGNFSNAVKHYFNSWKKHLSDPSYYYMVATEIGGVNVTSSRSTRLKPKSISLPNTKRPSPKGSNTNRIDSTSRNRTVLDMVNDSPTRGLVIESSPIPIPGNAKIKVSSKGKGYNQISYIWEDAQGRTLTARLHDPTPGAPPGTKTNWVIHRKTKGTPTGQRKFAEVYIGDGSWIPFHVWQRYVEAFRKGTATNGMRNTLRRGHFEVD